MKFVATRNICIDQRLWIGNKLRRSFSKLDYDPFIFSVNGIVLVCHWKRKVTGAPPKEFMYLSTPWCRMNRISHPDKIDIYIDYNDYNAPMCIIPSGEKDGYRNT